jgi:hypothetical protein
MELSYRLIDGALALLQAEGEEALPLQIGETPFFVAAAGDSKIAAYGIVRFNDVVYKIGVVKNK